ncbi:MAG: N-acetyl-gamma-glutamyl-phosphate reductase [Actinomycetia bacterium]|nr:N-acetyl-gamma-glutamyl-phosphate reductase [Actinomycetes bacterium]
MKKYKAAVVGATGFTGVELVSILTDHPRFELVAATSRDEAGTPLSTIYPALSGTEAEITLQATDTFDPNSVEVVFLAVPHTTAMDLVATLVDSNVKIVDLSADYRLKDAFAYEQWYGVPHQTAHLLEHAVYALPELTSHETIGQAHLLSCPGCYPTATALAAAPLLESSHVDPSAPVIVDAKSGVSGAGRKASEATQYATIDESVYAYRVTTHQHTPEIEQMLASIAGREVGVVFTPHLIPMKRGILSTVYISVDKTLTEDELFDLYQAAYSDEPFVTVLPQAQQPKTMSVAGTNHAQIGLALDSRTDTAIITCAIDNLGKGASSQAVQVANISFGLDQTAGLQPYRSIV